MPKMGIEFNCSSCHFKGVSSNVIWHGRLLGSKGFVVDGDTSEKQRGYMSVNKKNYAKGYFQHRWKHVFCK